MLDHNCCSLVLRVALIILSYDFLYENFQNLNNYSTEEVLFTALDSSGTTHRFKRLNDVDT